MEKESISKTNNVFTEKAHQMSHFQNFCINFGKALLKIILWLIDLVFSMFSSLWHFIKLLGVGIVKGIIELENSLKEKHINLNTMIGQEDYHLYYLEHHLLNINKLLMVFYIFFLK